MNLRIIFRTAAIFAIIAALGGVIVFVKLYSAVYQAQQSRAVAIQHWLDENPNGSEIVSLYREACESGPRPAVLRKSGDQPLSFAECSAQFGSESLTYVIHKAGDSAIAPPRSL